MIDTLRYAANVGRLSLRLVAIAVFCLLSATGESVAAPKLILNTSYTAPINSPDKTGVLDKYYVELFKRLGWDFEIQYLPAERALTWSDPQIVVQSLLRDLAHSDP